MFNTFIRKLKDDILKQKVKGHFASQNLSKHSFFLLILSILSIVMGCLMTHSFYNLYEKKINYKESQTISVFLPQSTIYFYIQIDNFYQSNLKYSKSISYDQLKGKTDTHSNVTDPLSSRNGRDFYPAGILPNTFFQDKFNFSNLKINLNDISWNSMRKRIKPSGYERNEVIHPPLWKKYKNIPDLSENTRFINWIYTAPFYNFRKLWGIINVEESGVYKVEIDSTFPYGKKSIFFSQVSWAGTKNYFLSMALIAMGLVGLVFSVFLYRKVL